MRLDVQASRPWLPARRTVVWNVAGFLGVLAVYLATATWSGWQSVDTLATWVPGWQLAHHGNLTLDQLHARGIPWFVHAGDRLVSNRFPGPVFLTVPFYWLFGSDTRPTLPPAAAASAVIAAATVVVMFHVLRRLADRTTALVATGVFAFATATWSVSADAIWTHGPAQLCLLLAVLAVAGERWLPAGLACGAAVLMRPHLGVVAVVLGLYHAWRGRSLRPAVLLAAGTAVGVGLLVLYDLKAFGSWSPTAYHPVIDYVGVGGVVSDSHPASRWSELVRNAAGVLFSPQRGLLLTTPFILALLPGLPRAWRAAPEWVRSATLAGTAYMLVQVNVNVFTGGNAFFGSRLTIEWLTLCAPLLLLSWREWAARSRVACSAVVVTVGLSFLVHSTGAMFYRPPHGDHGVWLTFDAFYALDRAPYAVAATLVAVVVLAIFVGLKAVDIAFSRESPDAAQPHVRPDDVVAES